MTFDAFLFQSFGGPNQKSDVIPFLNNVTKGRNIPQERLEIVAQQYYMFNGKSPINSINLDLIDRIKIAFSVARIDLPIYFGNRNFKPYIENTLEKMCSDGVTNAISFVTSAYGSYSGCKQYRQDIEKALRNIGDCSLTVTKIRHYYSHPGFILPFVDRCIEALNQCDNMQQVELLFTAHSIPLTMANSSPYLYQLNKAMEFVINGITESLGFSPSHALVFQSRSGSPNQKWLEPDISDYMRSSNVSSRSKIIAVPIGFISDHLEVIYDLDVLAKSTADELGVPFTRVSTPSNDNRFVEMIVDLTQELLDSSNNPVTLGTQVDLNGCSNNCCAIDPVPNRSA